MSSVEFFSQKDFFYVVLCLWVADQLDPHQRVDVTIAEAPTVYGRLTSIVGRNGIDLFVIVVRKESIEVLCTEFQVDSWVEDVFAFI